MADFALSLDLAPTSVLLGALALLHRDGYASLTPLAATRGGPRLAFSLSPAGQMLLPAHHARITCRLVQMLLESRGAAGNGSRDESLAALIFERLVNRMEKERAARLRRARGHRTSSQNALLSFLMSTPDGR